MTGIRLIDPEAMVKINADIAALTDAFQRSMLDFSQRLKRGNAAKASARRHDLDDEYDWLGEWRGRRG